jgi:putative ABC transport system permease protein
MFRLSPRTAKVLRDIWTSKSRTILVVLSIAVGVMAVGATLTIQSALGAEMDRNWQITHPSSGRVSISGFQPDFVDAVRQMPEVADADANNGSFMRVLGKDPSGSDAKFIQIYAIRDFDAVRINRFVREPGGEWPPPRRAIALSTQSLNLLGVKPGDTITLQTFDNRKMSMRIAGTAWTADEAGGPFAFSANGWVTTDTWEWMGNGRGFNTLLFRVQDDRLTDREHIQQVGEKIRKRAEKQGLSASAPDVPTTPNKHPAASSVSGIVALMTAMGIASLALSGFLVINTISAVLAQHVRQIGMMKAVGARTGQLSRMYYGMVLLYGALSLFVALPLGIFGAGAFVRYLGGTLLNLRVGTVLPPNWVFATQLAIALIAPLFAALAPVLSGTRKTVREAISDYGIGASASNLAGEQRGLARIIRLSRPLALSLRNTFRRKGRLALTLITLTLAGAVFISVISARQGLIRTLDVALDYWKYDFDVNLASSYTIDSVSRTALNVPGVKAVESWGWGDATQVLPGRKDGVGFTISAPPAGTVMLDPILLRGRWLQSTDVDAIVLNTDVLKRMNTGEPGAATVDVGSVIDVKINNSVKARLKVVGVVQGVLTGAIGYMNREGFMKIAQTGARVGYIAVQTNTRDPQQHIVIAKALEEAFKRANIKTGGTQQTTQIRTAIMQQFDIIIYILLAMAVLLAIVGGLGLAGTMGINVLERTREIGVMRAIGAGNAVIRRIVTVEGVLIGVISWAVGAALAAPFSLGISALLGQALEFEVFNAFSVPGVFLWLGIVVVIAVLASVMPAWNASRLTVREVLAYS